MYRARLNICIETGNAKVDATIKKIIGLYSNEHLTYKICSPDVVTQDSYVLYIGSDENTLHNLYYKLKDRLYYFWLGSMLANDYRLTNVLGFLPIDSQDWLLQLTITHALDYITTQSLAWLYKYLLQSLIDSSPNMVWFKDEQGKHTILNKAFGHVVNKPVEECLEKEHPDIWGIPWEEYESSDFACRQSEDEIIKNHKMGIFEEQVFTNGEMKQFITYKTPLYDELGNVLGTCGIGHDCTDLSNIGLQLDIILSSVPFPIFICDKEYNIIRMNNSAEALSSFTEKDKVNYKAWKDITFELVPDADSQTIYSTRTMLVPIQIEILEQPIRDYFDNITGYFCIFRDVTYSRLYEKSLHEAAVTDPLTGLYNRRYFYEILSKYKRKSMTLLYMDLDHFKEVNDTYGHNKGDDVLKVCAKNIAAIYKDYYTFRLGGDEFAVLMPEQVLGNTIVNLHSELLTKMDEAFGTDEVHCTLSLGINITDCLDDIDTFIYMADERMYSMKKEHHDEINIESFDYD